MLGLGLKARVFVLGLEVHSLGFGLGIAAGSLGLDNEPLCNGL